jgi:predicted PurR-regulated permease PerM
VALLVVGPVIVVTQKVVSELSGLLRAAPDNEDWRGKLQENPKTAWLLQWVEARFNITDQLRRLSDRLAGSVTQVVQGSIFAVAQLLITLFSLFYFFRDRWPVLQAIRSVVPLSNREANEVFGRVKDTIDATVFGGMTVALIQGVLGGVIFWVLSLPAPILWGFVMFLLSIVPMLGAFVVWIPAAIILLLQGHWIQAAVLAAWGMTAIGLIDNFLYPILVGQRLQLHPLPVFFSIAGGISVFGASGLILGPVALALLVAIVDIWRRRTAGGQPAEEALQADL